MSSSLVKTIAPLLALAFVACHDDDSAADSGIVFIDAGEPDAGDPDAETPDGDLDAAVPDADVDAAVPDADIDASPPDAGPPPPFGPPTSGNNNATLTGVSVGGGITEVSLLRKEIALEGNLSHAGLIAGPAYATRAYAESGAGVDGIIRVENKGDARQCFIEADNFLLLDAAGGVLVDESFTLFAGTVGKGQVTTDSCLAPGEVGYLVFLEFANFDQLATVRFDLSAFAASWGEPETAVRPTQISDAGNKFQVRVENQGTVTAKLESSARYVLFDDQGLPLHWGFFHHCVAAVTTLPPGEGTDMCAFTNYYDGQGDVLHAWVNFSVPLNAEKLATPDPRQELVRARTRELQRRHQAAR